MIQRSWRPLRPSPQPAPTGAEKSTRAGAGDAAAHEKQRAPASPYDLALNRSAEAWLQTLPETMRPLATARGFPRILNRLARYWDSPGMVDQIFDDLLVDRRGGRKGFPPNVLDELRALYGWHRAKHPQVESDRWRGEPDRGGRGRRR
jgi:hypothetical protein